MAYVDLDYDLTEEQKAAQDMAKRFALEVVRPKGIALDKLADPADVADKGSELWDVFRTYRELGLHNSGYIKGGCPRQSAVWQAPLIPTHPI